MEWYVREDGKTLFPKLVEELLQTGDWEVPRPNDWPTIRCEPKRKDQHWVWLELCFAHRTYPDVPSKGWAIVEASWVDPDSRMSPARVSAPWALEGEARLEMPYRLPIAPLQGFCISRR